MIPLAERMRPKSLEDFVGQKQLSLLYEMINNDAVSSMIFWGPPGVGKTTLAKIIAHRSQSYFVEFSAVTSGIKEIKKVMEEAKVRARMGQNTILFV
ncbi:MAG: AAA family ATPase, partial [Solobacterium sp.]|nr:AAA family ATPase [Solobacterium sp.]